MPRGIQSRRTNAPWRFRQRALHGGTAQVHMMYSCAHEEDLLLQHALIVAADVVPQLQRVLGSNGRAITAAVCPGGQTVYACCLVHVHNVVDLLPFFGALVVAHQPPLGFLSVLLCHGHGAVGNLLEEAVRQAPVDDGGGEHVEVGQAATISQLS